MNFIFLSGVCMNTRIVLNLFHASE